MNLLLLHPEDHLDDDRWSIADRRAGHVRDVLGLTPGARLRAGLLNGGIGDAVLTNDDGQQITLSFRPLLMPPPALPLTLILALPRPKMLKRILIDAASLGIKRIVLLNSWKVEKSYWHTPELHAGLLREKLILGLEQSGDTRLPELLLRDRFKPFVEDELPALMAGSRALLAHPGPHPPMPMSLQEPVTLAIGPEGGWTDYEAGQLVSAGFQCHAFGQRILRVETALPALVGRIMALP
ncbi:MAG: 16S rRNA (uracil(1498)-N(3))-methyltransferase [Pseudomonadaceae bacterium]|nr:16S rRNA (uracil(1498)-N(3))-methyltransferase [Pseudomonadaceae bacterium]